MNLSDITPVVITYNEAPNIGRCLEKLTWAKDIVIVDSFSNDETLTIVRRYPQARVFQRAFTSFSDQCNYAVGCTGIQTNWILSLDADYILTDDFIKEIQTLKPEANNAVGYETRFQYCIQGKVLRAAFYPPVAILFLLKKGVFAQDGHAHRVKLNGRIDTFKSSIYHDDRKSFARWRKSQLRYAKEEALKLSSAAWSDLNWKDQVRKLIIPAPLLIFFFGFFGKGLILDGLPGFVYCWQRFLAEFFLSLNLVKEYIHYDHSRC